MSKAKMEAARELIQEKKYDEARVILRTVDHPIATEWLGKIDLVDPPKMAAAPAAVAPVLPIKDEVGTEIKLVCPQCEQQFVHRFPIQEFRAGRGDVICPLCIQPFRSEMTRVRAKRSQGDKQRNRRHFSVRVYEPTGRERLIEFNRRGYGDFELRSGDLGVFSYIDNILRVVQNLTTQQYMTLNKPPKRVKLTKGQIIFVALLYLALGLVLLWVVLGAHH